MDINNQINPQIPDQIPQVPQTPIPPQQPVTQAPIPPQQPITPAPIPAQPTQTLPQTPPPFQNTYTQGAPKKKNYLVLALIIFVALVVVGIASGNIRPSLEFGNSKSKSTDSVFGNSKSKNNDSSLINPYDSKDSDGDKLPDWMEKELGFNPNESEWDRCSGVSNCADSEINSVSTQKHNVLIILDSSGSMQLKAGAKTKMEAAKSAIKQYLLKAKENPNVQIGFMLYGHKGSNSASDKAVSCQSAEVISPIGSFGYDNADTILANVRPVGWTPIGLSLKQALSSFSGKENDINEILLISDGGESCETNPVAEAATLKNSPYKITVNLIGFSVTSAEMTSLQSIAISGGGTFSAASTEDDLMKVFAQKVENLKKFREEIECKFANIDTVLACKAETATKVAQYIDTTTSNGNKFKAASSARMEFSNMMSKNMDEMIDTAGKLNREKAKQITGE